MRLLSVVLFGVLVTCPLSSGAADAPYQDPTLPVEARVDDLLARMTLQEKIAQMCQYVGIEHMRAAEKNMTAEEMKHSDAHGFYPGLHSDDVIKMIEEGMIGSFLHVITADETNMLQEHAMKSRLKVPLIIGIDAIHGNGLFHGATIYPTPIGLACTFDEALAEKIAEQTAVEMRATGSHWTFSPNVDVARDARWGRVGETFGEDPLLAGRLGAAMVRGYQGADFSADNKVIACVKHLIAGSEPINGLNASPMDVSERALRDVFWAPYLDCINAGVFTVMTAHNEVNGVPCHANGFLMTDLLRGETDFDGFIVSDWMDIERLVDLHYVAADQKEAVRLTVETGMDMHMHGPRFLEPLAELVAEGTIPEARIDESAARILTAKFKLGLFEQPFIDLEQAKQTVFQNDHQQTAIEAARKSIVLLKNDGLLPIDPARQKKVFVTGTNADNQTILGDWAFEQPEENVITVVEGLKQVAPAGCEVTYYDCGEDIRAMDDARILEAGRLAADADVAIVVVGENSRRWQWKDKTCGENVGRSDLQLPGKQQELVEAVHASGTPTIVVLVAGRPLSVEWIADNVAGLVQAWEPGSFGGQAIAEILFGSVNPSGKLPISIPRNVGQLQTIYNHKPSQYFHHYAFGETGALYPFGFGLSYTTFEYSNLRVPTEISPGTDVKVVVDVTNSGTRPGEEAVLCYVNDVVSSVTTPVRELEAFTRVALAPGETKAVTLKIAFDQLALLNQQMQRTVEPGQFEVFVGDQEAAFVVTE